MTAGIPANVLFSKDITQERRARQQRDQLATAMEQSAEAIAITNSSGIIQYANSAFNQINGYEKGEAIGEVASILKRYDGETGLADSIWISLTRISPGMDAAPRLARTALRLWPT